MSKSYTASRKQLKPDPRYGSLLAAKFVNCLMYDGKKSTAYQVFYDALDRIQERMPRTEVGLPGDLLCVCHVEPLARVGLKGLTGRPVTLGILEDGNAISLTVDGRRIAGLEGQSLGKGAVGIVAAGLGRFAFTGFALGAD